jgi:hypothetical protein
VNGRKKTVRLGISWRILRYIFVRGENVACKCAKCGR